MTPETPNPEQPALTLDERIQRNKALLLQALKGVGAVLAMVSYSGGGDEGFPNETSAVRADGESADLSANVDVHVEQRRFADQQWQTSTEMEDQRLDQALADFAMEMVELHHAGWYDGEGGSGQVMFDCAADVVRIEHREYYTATNRTETSL
ncbi:MAG TPA: hypothetical protein PK306_25530 [Aquabacterium sp.]|jgi:hypothetical protein|nr:hypothetical protein [Aquabacterium sp.]